MDEIQSWWEVPAVAHFCYVFRAAFNLFYIEIAELEAAILNIQDPELCISLEQIITRLLQGCYDDDDSVTPENWEQKLHQLFSANCRTGDENPYASSHPFFKLLPRYKVEILLKLCEYRLDASNALNSIKDISPETMKAKCVGKDSDNNLYWYFCDERLYKEVPSSSLAKQKKKKISISKEVILIKDSNVKNGRRQNSKKMSSFNDVDNSWLVVCHTLSDWEALVKKLIKSKNANEKELLNNIRNEYLPLLQDIVAEKGRLLRKRFLELAPKRTSSRISKVQAQKKLEELKATEAAERAKIEFEEEQARREEGKKKKEVEDRKKRAEERHKVDKAVEERAKRAEQRKQLRFTDDPLEEISSNISRTRQIFDHRKDYSESDSSSEVSDDDAEAEDSAGSPDNENTSDSEKSNGYSSESESESDSISENSQHQNESSVRVKKPVTNNTLERTQFSNSNIVKNSCELNSWNSTVDSKGRKLHILHNNYDELSSKKRFKPNESKDFRNGTGIQSSFINEKLVLKSINERNFNAHSRVTPSPSIIRLNFMKPPPKQVSS